MIFFSTFDTMKKQFFLFFLFLISQGVLFSANQLDSLKNILGNDISDSLRFEIYNRIFPIVVKQNIDSAKNCLSIQKLILKKAKFNEATNNEFFIDIYNRSEEHTSELQSHSFISYAVFCLKKKKKK